MKKIVAISGSLRKESYNTKLLTMLKDLVSNEVEYKILDISSIPLFNEDIEGNEFPNIVNEISNEISSSDIVIISTPEYNYSVSGVLKNALDWLSRGDNPSFENKNIIILSASLSRFGGVRAQSHLRQILLCLGANVLNEPEVFISNVDETIDNDTTLRQLKKIVSTIKSLF